MIQAIGHSPSSAISAALSWLQGIMLGSVAISVAIFAVASVGFLTLSGRIDLRHAAAVILGCFILFGAPFLANGLMAGSGINDPTIPSAHEVATPLAPPSYPDRPPSAFDPYAGASLGR